MIGNVCISRRRVFGQENSHKINSMLFRTPAAFRVNHLTTSMCRPPTCMMTTPTANTIPQSTTASTKSPGRTSTLDCARVNADMNFQTNYIVSNLGPLIGLINAYANAMESLRQFQEKCSR